MMSVAIQSLDFVANFGIACGCSSNASLERLSVRNYAKMNSRVWTTRAYGEARKSAFCRRVNTQCRVLSMKIVEPEPAVDGRNKYGQGLSTGLDLKNYPGSPISPSKLFEVVSDDLLTLNKNLKSIVGAENPVLMSAAEQIFSAGGKRMRPALVFLVSRATAELVGMKELTMKHRRLAEIIEMIHTASLIHDDVLDESSLRRGIERVTLEVPAVFVIFWWRIKLNSMSNRISFV